MDVELDLDGLTEAILCCVEGRLSVPACTTCTVAGLPVLDDCCVGGDCDGQLTVSVLAIFDADSQTLSRTLRSPCRNGTVAAEVLITLARCHPTVDQHGRPPSCEALAAAAAGVHRDMSDMWMALDCCPESDEGPCGLPRRVLDGIEIVNDAPEGGCVAVVARGRFEVARIQVVEDG